MWVANFNPLKEYLDLVFSFNAINNANDFDLSLLITHGNNVHLRSGELSTLNSKHILKTECFANFFSIRCINL